MLMVVNHRALLMLSLFCSWWWATALCSCSLCSAHGGGPPCSAHVVSVLLMVVGHRALHTRNRSAIGEHDETMVRCKHSHVVLSVCQQAQNASHERILALDAHARKSQRTDLLALQQNRSKVEV